ncbi:MAG: hypothetical protein KA264_09545 [Crocinitomicaceae bacterium]|nr:hypothetical protein [Crocinitomicaceae bacterium]
MHLATISNQTILYACNDWGMGHLTRSIPIIQQLLQQDNTLIFAGTEQQQTILKQYCKPIQCVFLKGYALQFSGKGNWTFEMLKNTYRIQKTIQQEHTAVKHLCQQWKISLVISDHRYGFRHQTIPSIFITHQVTLPLKGIQQFANQWHTNQLKKFNSIWVLDTDKHQFAGKLSTPKTSLPIDYIGIQSRFDKRNTHSEDYILAVISGPEPYAEELFNEIKQIALQTEEKIKCICPNKYVYTQLPQNLEIVQHTSWTAMDELFYNCKAIISRSGYTTIMDNVILQKPIRYIPTPGQLEQEYLFQLHNK